MSKTTNKTKRALTPNEIKKIIIVAICVVMVIVLAVSLPLLLKKTPVTPDTPDTDTSTSQSYIKNSDFTYFDKDNATFPKTADNWSKYTYKEPDASNDSHGFTAIENEDKVVMGIVNTDEETWTSVSDDLKAKGINGVANPKIHAGEELDTSIYMFAAKEATNASIVSASFSVPTQNSAKISVWLNTDQLTSGKAVVMLQKYQSTLSAKEDNRYAYEFNIGQQEGWQCYDFYLHNRNAGSEQVVVSVGLGNTYTNENAEGILFVDDINYETISTNEYRIFNDSPEGVQFPTRSFKLGEDKEVADENYATLTGYGTTTFSTYTAANYIDLDVAKVEGNAYSPFTKNEKFSIYKISNDGTEKSATALTLDTWNNNPIVVSSSKDLKDHLHISFWVRVIQNNVLAQGNIIVQTKKGADDFENLDSGSFTSVVTSQDISDDNNCGWVKYDIYLKPTSSADTTVRVLFALGNVKGYSSESKYTPNGSLFVTSPVVEQISYSDYSSASSGSYSKKVSLVGDTASTSVSNGSFSNTATNNPTLPTSWKGVFAGDNAIYNDGNNHGNGSGIVGLPNTKSDVTDFVVKNNNKDNTDTGAYAPAFDDSEQNYLRLTNNVATSYGYLSANISLSAHTAYAFSVLAKTVGDTNPYIYVVKDNADSRENAIIGKIETKVGETSADDNKFGMVSYKEEGNDWVRYYIVVVTGDDAMTVRMALFNGSIDASKKQAGTVYYDYAAMTTLGSYTIDTAEYKEGDEDAPATNRDRIKFTAQAGYSVFKDLADGEISTVNGYSNATVTAPSADDFNAMVEKAMAKDDDNGTDNTEKPTNTTDWALLLSVISSVALVGALLIVVVIRIFKRRNNQ